MAASIDGLVRARPRGGSGHAVAILVVGATILVAELGLISLDHGTHLLVALVLVAGTAILVGPGPALSGLVVGAGASIAAAAAIVEGVLARPVTYIQVAVYLLAGMAIVGLAWIAGRSRRATGGTLGPETRRTIPAAPPARLVEPLTERELEVLRLAASGIAVDAIGARLALSPNTVKTHLTHAYGKLGVRSRSDAIRAALHFGCLTPADICPHRFPRERLESPVRMSHVTGIGDDDRRLGYQDEGVALMRGRSPVRLPVDMERSRPGDREGIEGPGPGG